MLALAEEEVAAQEWEDVSLHALEGTVSPAVGVPGKLALRVILWRLF